MAIFDCNKFQSSLPLQERHQYVLFGGVLRNYRPMERPETTITRRLSTPTTTRRGTLLTVEYNKANYSESKNPKKKNPSFHNKSKQGNQQEQKGHKKEGEGYIFPDEAKPITTNTNALPKSPWKQNKHEGKKQYHCRIAQQGFRWNILIQ